MTNLDAIKAKLSYPLTENAFILCLKDRGLDEALTYVQCQAFDLAHADAIRILLTTPNVSEGGYTISLTDRATLKTIADGIYKKYGIADILKPSATFVQRW